MTVHEGCYTSKQDTLPTYRLIKNIRRTVCSHLFQ